MAARKTLLVSGLVVVGVAGGLVGHLTATKASGTSQTFTTDADAYVSARKPKTNTGGGTQLVVDGSPVRRAYLRFTVADLTGPLTRATLRVYATSSSRGGVAVSRVADSSWAEQTITWSDAPAILAPSVASDSGFSPGWVAIDVTSLVAGEGVVTLAITEQSSTAVALRSREAGAASAPQLVVEADTSATATSGTTTTNATATTAPATTTATTPPTTTDTSPVIAAAGDIACNSAPATIGTTCQQRLTASLLAAGPSLSGVLTLGDLQYECGDYSNLLKFYDPTWGQFRALTHPAIGNHEYLTTRGASNCDASTTVPAQGYFDYWDGVGAGCTTTGGCAGAKPTLVNNDRTVSARRSDSIDPAAPLSSVSTITCMMLGFSMACVTLATAYWPHPVSSLRAARNSVSGRRILAPSGRYSTLAWLLQVLAGVRVVVTRVCSVWVLDGSPHAPVQEPPHEP